MPDKNTAAITNTGGGPSEVNLYNPDNTITFKAGFYNPVPGTVGLGLGTMDQGGVLVYGGDGSGATLIKMLDTAPVAQSWDFVNWPASTTFDFNSKFLAADNQLISLTACIFPQFTVPPIALLSMSSGTTIDVLSFPSYFPYEIAGANAGITTLEFKDTGTLLSTDGAYGSTVLIDLSGNAITTGINDDTAPRTADGVTYGPGGLLKNLATMAEANPSVIFAITINGGTNAIPNFGVASVEVNVPGSGYVTGQTVRVNGIAIGTLTVVEEPSSGTMAFALLDFTSWTGEAGAINLSDGANIAWDSGPPGSFPTIACTNSMDWYVDVATPGYPNAAVRHNLVGSGFYVADTSGAGSVSVGTMTDGTDANAGDSGIASISVNDITPYFAPGAEVSTTFDSSGAGANTTPVLATVNAYINRILTANGVSSVTANS